MYRRSWAPIALAAALLALTICIWRLELLTAVRLVAQSQSSGSTTPTFRTGGNYVRVDVYATRNGTPVTDLRQDEFTILEDGKRQDIDRFEFINIRDVGSAPVFLEPPTVAAARQPTADGRTRLFVLFLDRPHVDDKGSGTIREPLLNALRRTITDRDLVAVMTPDMTITELSFTTKTTALERFLERDRFWGERSRLTPADPFETQLRRCYGTSKYVDELIARRREKRTFDAVRSLVEYLGDLREERKAILLFSSGWLRFEPTTRFDDLGTPPIATPNPGGLALPGGLVQQSESSFLATCFAERTALARIDHALAMDELMALANRGNTSFYPIDPRGLAVFDDPDAALGGGSSADLEQDRRNLQKRLVSLRELAEGTDGVAVVNTNSLDSGLRRIVDDLSSYYLLSYASSGELDGKFHAISVRTSRPGVTIRARRGFLATRPVERSTTRGGSGPAPPVAPDAVTLAARTALERLAGAVRDVPAGATVAAGWTARGTTMVPSFTIVGEVADRSKGAAIEVAITNQDGDPTGSGQGRIAPGTTSTIVQVAAAEGTSAGAYVARIRIQNDAGTETLRMPVNLPEAPGGAGAVYYRRGQATGNREVVTADLRFRRSDRLRIEMPTASDGTATARVLDRNGVPINVPVESSVRTADDGARWIGAAPLSASLGIGDYLVEFDLGTTRVLAPFRIVP